MGACFHQVVRQNQLIREKNKQYTNTEIIFRTVGVERGYSETVMNILTRILQESLTNAKRHGLAPKVEIQIFHGVKQIDLTTVQCKIPLLGDM
jgi:signal transduction histidine kinase